MSNWPKNTLFLIKLTKNKTQSRCDNTHTSSRRGGHTRFSDSKLNSHGHKFQGRLKVSCACFSIKSATNQVLRYARHARCSCILAKQTSGPSENFSHSKQNFISTASQDKSLFYIYIIIRIFVKMFVLFSRCIRNSSGMTRDVRSRRWLRDVWRQLTSLSMAVLSSGPFCAPIYLFR